MYVSNQNEQHYWKFNVIHYKVYPGNSARWFPEICAVVFVKPDLYERQ